MKIKEFYKDDKRWYRVSRGTYSEDVPSVNTVIAATESDEDKQRLINWKFKQAQKFFTANRTCQNCLHLKSVETHKGFHTVESSCLVGEKLRSPIDKKHRCKSFNLNAEMEAAKLVHGEKARERGTEVHRHIENWFDRGILPTPEHCKYSSKITYLLKQLAEGKHQVEKAVCSQAHGYAGRVDFFGEYLDQITVIDWVTTDRNYLQRENFHRKFLQCAAYAVAIAEMGLTTPTEIIVVAMSPASAELFREPLDKWTDIWIERIGKFWSEYEVTNGN